MFICECNIIWVFPILAPQWKLSLYIILCLPWDIDCLATKLGWVYNEYEG